MTKTSTLILFIYLLVGTLRAASIIENLSEQIAHMQEGDKVLLEYTFQGCFGPYHHGNIEMELKGNTVHYVTRSFDEKGAQPMTQASQYDRDLLLELLADADKKKSGTVFGNAIEYTITSGANKPIKDGDQIEQRHFIELFHPFTSIFKMDDKQMVPKLKSGGFVH